jgi:hypothetical protein
MAGTFTARANKSITEMLEATPSMLAECKSLEERLAVGHLIVKLENALTRPRNKKKAKTGKNPLVTPDNPCGFA